MSDIYNSVLVLAYLWAWISNNIENQGEVDNFWRCLYDKTLKIEFYHNSFTGEVLESMPENFSMIGDNLVKQSDVTFLYHRKRKSSTTFEFYQKLFFYLISLFLYFKTKPKKKRDSKIKIMHQCEIY